MQPWPNRIRMLRKAKHLTQVEFALALGVNEATVVRWERGYTNLPYDTLDHIARFFQVAPAEVVPALAEVPLVTIPSEGE